MGHLVLRGKVNLAWCLVGSTITLIMIQKKHKSPSAILAGGVTWGSHLLNGGWDKLYSRSLSAVKEQPIAHYSSTSIKSHQLDQNWPGSFLWTSSCWNQQLCEWFPTVRLDNLVCFLIIGMQPQSSIAATNIKLFLQCCWAFLARTQDTWLKGNNASALYARFLT